VPQFALGETIFRTKGEATEYFRGLLWGAEIGARIGEPDATRLADLIKLHPEFVTKQGAGISYFRAAHTLFGARGFEIVRTDGSVADFSFYTCLTPQKSDRSRILAALRAEVHDDILRAKDDYFRRNGALVKCAITSELISCDECHADHAPPLTFGNLADSFIAARADEFTYCRFCHEPYGDRYRPRLADRGLAERWRTYHHTLANIRLVSKTANLSTSRVGMPNPKDRQLILRADDV
jgi:Protein of unknown function (DUF3223)